MFFIIELSQVLFGESDFSPVTHFWKSGVISGMDGETEFDGGRHTLSVREYIIQSTALRTS